MFNLLIVAEQDSTTWQRSNLVILTLDNFITQQRYLRGYMTDNYFSKNIQFYSIIHDRCSIVVIR